MFVIQLIDGLLQQRNKVVKGLSGFLESSLSQLGSYDIFIFSFPCN